MCSRKTWSCFCTINSLFQKTLEGNEVTQIIQELQKRKLITIDQENVSYKLPASMDKYSLPKVRN
jgi:uncharacterized membrane protein